MLQVDLLVPKFLNFVELLFDAMSSHYFYVSPVYIIVHSHINMHNQLFVILIIKLHTYTASQPLIQYDILCSTRISTTPTVLMLILYIYHIMLIRQLCYIARSYSYLHDHTYYNYICYLMSYPQVFVTVHYLFCRKIWYLLASS